jgi:hypothetical protein
MRPFGPGREIAPGTTVLEHLHRSNGLDVYDAWSEPRGCRVIVKTLRPDRVRKPAPRTKLVREGRLTPCGPSTRWRETALMPTSSSSQSASAI